MFTFSFSETLPKQPQGFNVEAVNDTAVRYKGYHFKALCLQNKYFKIMFSLQGFLGDF